jgi:hypothetical protein
VVAFGFLTVGGEVHYNKVFADGDADAFVVGAGLGLTFWPRSPRNRGLRRLSR